MKSWLFKETWHGSKCVPTMWTVWRIQKFKLARKQLETEHALHQLDGDWGLMMERRFLGWFLPPMHIWGHCVGLYNRLWLQIIREELSSFYTCRLWYQPRPLSRGEDYTTGTVAANVARNGTITRQDGHVVITRHSFNYADNGLHTMQWLWKASKRLLKETYAKQHRYLKVP